MSAPKFTPGPWAFEKWFYGGHGYRIYSARGAHSIAGTSGHPYDFANAQLIAAAPELYAALEVLVTSCPRCAGTGSYDAMEGDPHSNILLPVSRRCERCAPARVALAKARGEKT